MQKQSLKINTAEYASLFWALVISCMSLSPILFHFIWGNHDWMPLLIDSSLSAGLIEGRFTQYIFLNILLMGKILPLLNVILGLIFYATALVLLWKRFFRFSIPVLPATLFTTTCLTLPYIDEILYFQFIVFSQLTWPLIIVLALLEAQQAHKSHYILHTALSTLLLFFAIGGYPATAGLYITAACLWAIQLNTTLLNFKSFISRLLPFALSLLISFALLNIVYIWLQKNNIMIPLYNNQTITLLDLLHRIPLTLKASIISLIQPQPYFSLFFKILSTAIIALFIINHIKLPQKNFQYIRTVLLIIALLLAIKFPALLAGNQENNYFAAYDPIEHMVRTDFYTIPCLILFCLFYLYQNATTLLRNLLFLAAIILLWLNISTNLTFCKTHLLGFTAENKLLERIIAQIQNKPNFNVNQNYTVVQIGEIALRSKYYQPTSLEKYGYYTLQVPYTRYWVPNEYYNFYTPVPFTRSGNEINPEHLSPQALKFFTTEQSFWPASSAVFIDNEYIIIPLTKAGRFTINQQFNAIAKNIP